MFRKMTIAKRFGFILFIIFIITLPIITTVMYYFFRENAIREVADKALLTMHSMDSLRKYMGKELPKKFVLEAASGFYILRKVSYNLQEVQPYYIYKQATNNPLALENRADYHEEQLLKRFKENDKLNELTGLKTDGREPLYYIARPVKVDRRECMNCHGDPPEAPKVQVAKYGTSSGYNYAMDAVVATNIIYVPASVPIAIATRSTTMVAVVFTMLFFILFVIINILIRKSIIRPIENFVKVAGQVSKGQFDNKFEINTQDELKTLADSFTRLKTSIAMLMDMINKPGK